MMALNLFLGSYSVQVLDQLIKTLTNLLLSNKREVVKSALGFFKVRFRAITFIFSQSLVSIKCLDLIKYFYVRAVNNYRLI